MLVPAYKVTIGKTTIDTSKRGKAGSVVELTVTLDMSVSADSFTIRFGQTAGMPRPAIRDKVTVALGYSDDGTLVQVIAGTVFSVESTLKHLTVVGYTGAETLVRTFLNQTYESQSAGAIVQDLTRRAGVQVANAEDGINFPAYVIDGRRNFSRHIGDLAGLSGFDAYFNSEGKLVFQKFVQPKAVHTFEHSKDVLELNISRAPGTSAAVQAFGESPASAKGAASAAWLTKNFDRFKGTAGTGKPVLLLERPALRTKEAAKTTAVAEETRIRRNTVQGKLLSVGRPEVKLGDSVQLRAVPDASLNKTFQVRAVTHRITKRGGFTTEIGFRSI